MFYEITCIVATQDEEVVREYAIFRRLWGFFISFFSENGITKFRCEIFFTFLVTIPLYLPDRTFHQCVSPTFDCEESPSQWRIPCTPCTERRLRRIRPA